MNTSTLVLLLGMHRSGTSCLAGSLEEAGLMLGDVNKAAPFNAKGNRENRSIMELHDAVLLSNNGAWDDVPPTVHWLPQHQQTWRRLVSKLTAQKCTFGIKDPRTLLLLDQWREWPGHLELVGTFRHPAHVAASLRHRNGMDVGAAQRLWLEYNERLLRAWERKPFPLLNFDWDNDKYRERLRTLASKLKLPAPNRASDFFEDSLVHHVRVEEQPSMRVSSTYTRLIEAAEIFV